MKKVSNLTLGKWIIQNSKFVLDTEWAKVRKDTCLLPTGKIINDYYLWVENNFVMIFGLTENNQVVLVKQYKHGAQDIVLELPAGLIDKLDENPEVAAARELREETGYEAKTYIHLINTFTSSAKATTMGHFYLATGLEKVTNPKLDDTEIIENFCVSIPELIEMVNTNRIQDVNSIAIIFLALQKLSKLELKPERK